MTQKLYPTVTAAGRCRTCGARWRTYRPGDGGPFKCANEDCPGLMEVTKVEHLKVGAVEAFIDRQRGDASHAAVIAGAMCARKCLDASSFERNEAVQRRLERFYRTQAAGRQLISTEMFPGSQRVAA
jgi:hypothetical protein